MAHVTLFNLPATAFHGDDGPLVGGDGIPAMVYEEEAWFWGFDADAEEAVMSLRLKMPGQYAGGTLKATIWGMFASETTVTDEAVFDVSVEAITPTDEVDMDAGTYFDSVNPVEIDPRTTAGWPAEATVTLTNADSAAALDLVRFHIRRDCDASNGLTDSATGDFYLGGVEIWEDT